MTQITLSHRAESYWLMYTYILYKYQVNPPRVCNCRTVVRRANFKLEVWAREKK